MSGWESVGVETWPQEVLEDKVNKKIEQLCKMYLSELRQAHAIFKKLYESLPKDNKWGSKMNSTMTIIGMLTTKR